MVVIGGFGISEVEPVIMVLIEGVAIMLVGVCTVVVSGIGINVMEGVGTLGSVIVDSEAWVVVIVCGLADVGMGGSSIV
jgi:hypothetical protein